MLKLRVRAVGNLHRPWDGLAEEYLKRVKPFAKVSMDEVKESRFVSATDRDRVLAEEAEKLTRDLPAGAFVVAMTERGKGMTSEAFSRLLSGHESVGREIAFLVGGPLGIGGAALERADLELSLSPMTFTHEMARVILLEQIYRAATIAHGKAYHY